MGYDANGLNQYERTRFAAGTAVGQRLFYDEDGNLTGTKVIADMNCDGSVNSFDIQPFTFLLAHDCAQFEQEYGCDCLNGDINGDGSVNPFDVEPFLGVVGGGPGAEVSIPMQKYVWDAENRLIRVEPPGEPGPSAEMWEYTYDYLGRRVAKTKYARNNGVWEIGGQRKFVCDGWNVIMELDDHIPQSIPPTPATIVRKYTWGLDLAGQDNGIGRVGGRTAEVMRVAGGIGGLLGTRDVDSGDDYAYLYDANGNVGQMVALGETGATPDVVAAYEYDPYGGTIASFGVYADANTLRYSTKYFDAETSFANFGRRHYSARLGRWLNRDPIGEAGGEALYAFVRNGPTNAIDPYGLWGDGTKATREELQSRLNELQALSDEAMSQGNLELHAALQSTIQTLQAVIDQTPPGHSDFPGSDEFDYTLEDKGSTGPGRRPWRHFQPLDEVEPKVDAAISSCNKEEFERTMHQGQDSFTHWNGGYRWYLGGHLCRSDDPDDSIKYPDRYKQARGWTQRKLDDWNKNCRKDENGNWQKRYPPPPPVPPVPDITIHDVFRSVPR